MLARSRAQPTAGRSSRRFGPRKMANVLAGEDGLVTDAAADIALLDGCRERRADVGGVDAAVLEGGGHVRVGQRRLLHVGDRQAALLQDQVAVVGDRKSTRLNSSH